MIGIRARRDPYGVGAEPYAGQRLHASKGCQAILQFRTQLRFLSDEPVLTACLDALEATSLELKLMIDDLLVTPPVREL